MKWKILVKWNMKIDEIQNKKGSMKVKVTVDVFYWRSDTLLEHNQY